MKIKHLILLFVSIVAFIKAPCAEAQTYEKYGFTKMIYPKTGKEFRQSETVAIALSGNNLTFGTTSLGAGIWRQEYGVFSHYQNGNKIYTAKAKGNGIFGSYDGNDDSAVGGAYYVVSPDNTVVNKVSLDNIGQPQEIRVYRKANTEAIEQIYR